MQEIKKSRIVIASVLKPVDDTRMYEKIGRSLAKYHDVHVIGFEGPISSEIGNPKQTSIGKFGRLGIVRLLKPWQILCRVFQIKPDILIISTHELILPALIAKAFLSCRIWYDVQENYAFNIKFTNSFKPFLRPVLAGFVRLKERMAAPLIERFLLAERSYALEMPFMARRSIVVENKFRKDATINEAKKSSPGCYALLFSGTLSEATGVYSAIDIASALHSEDARVTLTIIGYCSMRRDYERLMGLVRNKKFITFIGGNALVPHARIVEEIRRSDLGVICYPPNPATRNSVPTKLYEYLANKLPILLIENPLWVEYAAKYDAAIPFSPDQFNAAEVLRQLRKKQFYSSDPEDVYWESEEKKLLQMI